MSHQDTSGTVVEPVEEVDEAVPVERRAGPEVFVEAFLAQQPLSGGAGLLPDRPDRGGDRPAAHPVARAKQGGGHDRMASREVQGVCLQGVGELVVVSGGLAGGVVSGGTQQVHGRVQVSRGVLDDTAPQVYDGLGAPVVAVAAQEHERPPRRVYGLGRPVVAQDGQRDRRLGQRGQPHEAAGL